jgi:hypothetical protein
MNDFFSGDITIVQGDRCRARLHTSAPCSQDVNAVQQQENSPCCRTKPPCQRIAQQINLLPLLAKLRVERNNKKMIGLPPFLLILPPPSTAWDPWPCQKDTPRSSRRQDPGRDPYLAAAAEEEEEANEEEEKIIINVCATFIIHHSH